MGITPRLGAPELVLTQALPETTVNEQLRYAEQGASLFIVKDKDLATPPGSPTDGDAYIVAGSPTGAWTGKAKSIAFYMNTGWLFITPIEGTRADVQDEDAEYRYSGSAWVIVAASGAALTSDTDGTLAANSDARVATQKAVKTYVDANVTGLLEIKGSTNCSANPNYPAALKGDAYLVSTAGKIGGGSGKSVDLGDWYVCITDNAGGTEASVGTSWTVLEHNLSGVVLLSGSTMTGALSVPDDAYDATTWNSSAEVPTKNAVRDKIEAIVAGVPSAYTDEMAQDAVGAMLADSSTIDVTYNDAGNAETFDVIQTALKPIEHIIIACSDESTAITTGTAKATFRMPYAFTVTDVRASVNTAPTGSTILIDINESGTTIISTKLMIDAGEKTSTTAATPAVISDASLADDAEITIDFDQVGSTISGKGVKVTIIGRRT